MGALIQPVGGPKIIYGFILNFATRRILFNINWVEFLQISQGHSISSDIFPLETDIPPPISPILTNYTTCCCESPLFLLNIIIFPFVVYDYIHNHLYMTFLFNLVKNILINHVCSEVLCLTTVLLDLILPHIHRLIIVFSPI